MLEATPPGSRWIIRDPALRTLLPATGYHLPAN
jgi:hypothetical protein